jgi:excisionase family DNA binding protein
MTIADRIEAIDHQMKAPEVARLLDLPLQRVYRLARENEIPSYRFGTSVLFDPQSVADWLRTRLDPEPRRKPKPRQAEPKAVVLNG